MDYPDLNLTGMSTDFLTKNLRYLYGFIMSQRWRDGPTFQMKTSYKLFGFFVLNLILATLCLKFKVMFLFDRNSGLKYEI